MPASSGSACSSPLPRSGASSCRPRSGSWRSASGRCWPPPRRSPPPGPPGPRQRSFRSRRSSARTRDAQKLVDAYDPEGDRAEPCGGTGQPESCPPRPWGGSFVGVNGCVLGTIDAADAPGCCQPVHAGHWMQSRPDCSSPHQRLVGVGVLVSVQNAVGPRGTDAPIDADEGALPRGRGWTRFRWRCASASSARSPSGRTHRPASAHPRPRRAPS